MKRRMWTAAAFVVGGAIVATSGCPNFGVAGFGTGGSAGEGAGTSSQPTSTGMGAASTEGGGGTHANGGGGAGAGSCGTTGAGGEAAMCTTCDTPNVETQLALGNGSGMVGLRALAMDDDGSVYAAGSYGSSAGFGCHHVAQPDGNGLFVEKLDATGHCIWLVDATFARVAPERIALRRSGSDVLVAGGFSGSFSLETVPGVDASLGSQKALGTLDVFVARLSTGTGKAHWVQAFGPISDATSSATATGVDLGDDGAPNVTVAGIFDKEIKFDGSTAFTAGAAPFSFVANLDLESGAFLHATELAGDGTIAVSDMAVDPATHDVALTGQFAGSQTFGDASPHPVTGTTDAFVLRLSSHGDYRKVFTFGATSAAQAPSRIAVVGENIVSTGAFSGDPGVAGLPAATDPSAYVLQLEHETLEVRWIKSLGALGMDPADRPFLPGLSVSQSGRIVVAGSKAPATAVSAGVCELASANVPTGFALELGGESGCFFAATGAVPPMNGAFAGGEAVALSPCGNHLAFGGSFVIKVKIDGASTSLQGAMGSSFLAYLKP